MGEIQWRQWYGVYDLTYWKNYVKDVMESLHKHPLVTKLVLVNRTSIAEKFDPNLPFLVVLTSDKITTVKRKKQH